MVPLRYITMTQLRYSGVSMACCIMPRRLPSHTQTAVPAVTACMTHGRCSDLRQGHDEDLLTNLPQEPGPGVCMHQGLVYILTS